MRGSIRNIRVVHKFGAFGDPNSMGVWIYGKRPDGRTVACKNKTLESGGVRIWSTYWKGEDAFEAVTEFSEEEWRRIYFAADHEQQSISNGILSSRPSETH